MLLKSVKLGIWIKRPYQLLYPLEVDVKIQQRTNLSKSSWLITLMSEVSAIVKGRPITTIPFTHPCCWRRGLVTRPSSREFCFWISMCNGHGGRYSSWLSSVGPSGEENTSRICKLGRNRTRCGLAYDRPVSALIVLVPSDICWEEPPFSIRINGDPWARCVIWVMLWLFIFSILLVVTLITY